MIIYLQMIESDEDKSKFEQLYIMYKGLMFHVAMKILKNEFDAEDAVHQAFLSLIENLKKIAAACADAETFKAEVRKQYPAYSGQNYLDMTAGFFYA